MSPSIILNRRNFLQSSLAGASAVALGLRPSEAHRRSETLLVVQELGPGSLEKPEQCVVVDAHAFRINCVRKDKMLLFNVAVVVPFVINSELAKKNATPEDRWALAWLKNNEAGGGAYRIESWKPGIETIF